VSLFSEAYEIFINGKKVTNEKLEDMLILNIALGSWKPLTYSRNRVRLRTVRAICLVNGYKLPTYKKTINKKTKKKMDYKKTNTPVK